MMRWSLLLSAILFAKVALAEPPAPKPDEDVRTLIEQQLVAPLAQAEQKRSKFSRAMPVPIARRIRLLDQGELTDAQGKSFVRFIVDERRGWNDKGTWRARFTGCAYASEGTVYIKQGNAHTHAKSALTGEGETNATVCRAGTARGAEVASAR